ncbi:LytTR family DNA-binding domain-containing protein [uncultured Clostridium sp.]|uniref:LytR/AlgR family response regulator transcription factor n=1 Tax=uncultured Clostridium sp. TaxID=59620 RepID=UPI0025D54D24|nr:LytTR family DNA-binding domain-containing protein [uncultured Clostridium sp.]
MDIILCEDNLHQRRDIEKIITNEIKDLDFKIALSTNNPNEVIKHVEDNSSNNFIYFLDIDLQNSINGIELAKLIRKYDSSGYIIFLTAHAELTLLTFQYKVRAMDYILKGDSKTVQEKIHDCLSQICTDIANSKNKKSNIIPIDIGNNLVFFDLDDVLFFETADTEHKIRIHTSTGYSEFYGTLKDIETNLTPSYYKPHRSYLVNTKKIKSIDKENLIIHMLNGETCYVASRYLKGLLQKCLK